MEWEQLGLVAVGDGADASYAVHVWEVLAAGLRKWRALRSSRGLRAGMASYRVPAPEYFASFRPAGGHLGGGTPIGRNRRARAGDRRPT